MEERLAKKSWMLQTTQVLLLKREDTHKMADANRAFAHYRW